ncbi:MAG: flagellar protein export ATPase FliI [Epulopiscium sp.]|nr:flagellar protein export ATPase FliI [Candidatus Epulonipiscium sp.]
MLSKYTSVLAKNYIKQIGRVAAVIGLTIESIGPPASVGDLCKIYSLKTQEEVYAQVVGFKDHRMLLMPLGNMEGIGPGSLVENTGVGLTVPVGEQLLGRVLDGLGNPIDGKEKIGQCKQYPLENTPPDPLMRNRIQEPLPLGVKAIDGLLTVGKGQRMGIFAGSGVGKSTLLGMMARNTQADVNVIALIGERGREVREFLEKDLGEEGLRRSVLVVATSDQPALIRLMAAQTATAIAEYFRDQGNDVLLMMDSLTRFAMAQREIGLAIGEPPVTRGYTPSVYAVMPKLLERAGHSEVGSITGLYTVLVDGDDMNEPVADTARGILDGHIVLSRKLANKNHYPAIAVLESVSRVMGDVIDLQHQKNAFMMKKLLATYTEAEDLINIGAYVTGSNPDIDEAILKMPAINQFLTQDISDDIQMLDVIQELAEITDGKEM